MAAGKLTNPGHPRPVGRRPAAAVRTLSPGRHARPASTHQSLASHLGAWTPYFLIFTILLLAFGSITYNVCLAENAPTVITHDPMDLNVLCVVFMGMALMGGVAPGATTVICFSDPTMGVVHDYRARTKGTIDRPIFNPGEFRDVGSNRTARVAKVPAKE